MKLIIGLGNPGKEYENTRHNIGFKVIDAIAHSIGVELKKKKYNGKIYVGNGFVLAKPLTYMNNSGDFVQQIVKFYNVHYEDLIIIYDDMSIPVGEIMMKPQGSAAGQNGMKDIILKLGTNKIQRLKIGIGKARNTHTNYVLGNFSKIQIMKLDKIRQNIIDSIMLFIEKDFDSAMKMVNTKC